MSQAVVSQIVPSEVTLSPSACREKQLFLIPHVMNPFAVTNNCPLSLFTMFGEGFKKSDLFFTISMRYSNVTFGKQCTRKRLCNIPMLFAVMTENNVCINI